MAGSGDSEWYVSSCGFVTVEDQIIRLFKVTHHHEFVGVIGAPEYTDTSEILVMASQVDWPQKIESIEDYVKRIEND
jgi:hypothetical protein